MRSTGLGVLGDVSMMRTLLCGLLLLAPGCVRTYVEPRIDEPHATVKIRVVHHERSGPQLETDVRLSPGGEHFGIAMPDDDGMRVVRVRLLPTGYSVSSSFFHTVMQMQTVYESESYQCGTMQSGYGHSSYSHPQYCTRQVPRQRMVSVRMRDGECDARAFQAVPLEGAVYLVQYDYFGPGVCSMTCMRQIDTGGGTFQLVPCGRGEPSVATSGGAVLVAPTVSEPVIAPPRAPIVPPVASGPGARALASPLAP